MQENLKRCHWANTNNLAYLTYHDEEWGVPSYDDEYLFEMLILESFQAGLSWECILNKREAFRSSFDDFDYHKIALYDENKVASLLQNKDIIRNRLKINAAITNARVFMSIQDEFGSFARYIWSFTEGKTIYGDGTNTHSPLSNQISQSLKSRGMRFVGTTIIYSYLQAIGIINDHEPTCYLHVV